MSVLGFSSSFFPSPSPNWNFRLDNSHIFITQAYMVVVRGLFLIFGLGTPGWPGVCFVDKPDLNSPRSTCLCFPRAGIKDLCHDIQPYTYFTTQLSKADFLTSQTRVYSTTEVSYTKSFLFTLISPEINLQRPRKSLTSLGHLH